MPGAPWSGDQNDTLSGLWGVFQQSAEQHLTASDIWSQLRQTVGQQYYQSRGLNVTAGEEEYEEVGRTILSNAGVGITNVNLYRQIAGRWLQAKQNLQSGSQLEQIQGNGVFIPPWATTTSGAVPSRYRIRAQWQFTNPDGTGFTKWSTYELTGPLSTLANALNQAAQLAVREGSSINVSTASLGDALDYEIEQI